MALKPLIVCLMSNFFRFFNTFRLAFVFYVLLTEFYGYYICVEKEPTVLEYIWLFLGYPLEQTCPVFEVIVWRIGSKLAFVLIQKLLTKTIGQFIVDRIRRKITAILSSYSATLKRLLDEFELTDFEMRSDDDQEGLGQSGTRGRKTAATL